MENAKEKLRIELRPGRKTTMPSNHTKERPNSTNSPHTLIVPPRRTTGKRITRPDTNIPNKHWNMPIKPFNRILLRGFQQQDIQLFPTRYPRHRYQMVAAK